MPTVRAPKLRTYQPIWNALKDPNKLRVSIAADPALHPRLVKSVIKEKYMDKGWALLMLEAGKKYKLAYVSSNKILTFTLLDVTPIIYKL